jgi:DNA-binding CsgD family transcriptional regulator
VDDVRAGARPGAPQLVGRDTDLHAVRTFVEASIERGGALLLSGDPGVGKSALLDAAADSAGASGARVLRTSGAEFGPEVGLSGLDQLLTPLHDEFAQLPGAQRTGLSVALGLADGPAPGRLIVSNATLQLLRRAAEVQPVLVIVDDVHWLDRSTADVLAFVARRLVTSRVALLGAHRTGSVVSLEQAGLPEHELRPLGRAWANRLLEISAPDLAPRARARILTEADGNPLALVELPAALTSAQRADLQPLPRVLPLGAGLQRLFAARITGLPRPTRDLLLLGALHGSGELTVLRDAAHQSGGLDGLAAAERAGLVRVHESSGRLSFRHPLVRSTVVDVSSALERRRAHRALAGALPGQPERQAWHLADATPHPDEDVAARLEHGARLSLRRGDALLAVDALSRAAQLSPAPADRRRRRAEAAYLGADVTGRLGDVMGLLGDADDHEGPTRSLSAAVAQAYLLLNSSGDVDAAHHVLVAAIRRHTEHEGRSDPAFAEALHTLLLICFFGGRAELWVPFDAAIARLGPATPTSLLLTYRTMASPGLTAASVIDRLDAEIHGLGHVVDPTTIVRIAMAGFYVDRLSACRDAVLRVLDDGRRGGAVASAIDSAMFLAFDHLGNGEWERAQQYAEEGLALCAAHGYELLAWPGRLALALLAALRGDDHVVRSLTGQMTAWAEPRRVGVVLCYARHARALAALGRCDFDGAYREAAGVSPPGIVTSHVAHALPVAMDLVEAAVHSGRPAQAVAHVTAMETADLPSISPRLALMTAGARAMVTTDATASDRFEHAAGLPGADRWPFELARIHLAHGEHLRRRRDGARAREELREALVTFQRLGAQPWVARASAELRAAGEAGAVGTTYADVRLTGQELEIATMAACGMTNKQIAERLHLSHRTVGAHLYRIFPRLGITSRAALRDALGTAQGPPGNGGRSG